ncbi:MAG: MltA domain-containing protein [Gemmatimonadota bacterium]|nr:MAG: MltA domain-containing protein [Gemmatimonadota bacterium]
MIYGARPDTVHRGLARASALLVLAAVACQPPSGAGVVGGPREGTPRPEPPPAEPSRREPERPEATGAALEPVGSGVPEVVRALEGDRASLLAALEQSLTWFGKPSSRDYYPAAGVTHERAWASVYAFRELTLHATDAIELARWIHDEFEVYASGGGDGRGTVLFTGYYSPAFAGSLSRSGEYQYPLYRRPDDLVSDTETGETMGRRVGNRIVPYPTRAEIERSGMLSGGELVWLRDRFEAYLVHVQGSAAITLPDGSVFRVGYAGNNGHDYVSVARALVDDGRLAEDELSLEEVRAHFEAHPEDLDPYLRRNPRFVFFRRDDDGDWPAGSLGVKVTPLRTLATDKEVFPAGGVVLVVTHTWDASGRMRRFEQIMLDQDAGGAIRTAGRADIYYGVGRGAEALAGNQYAEGRLYYLFLKPERVAEWSPGLDF